MTVRSDSLGSYRAWRTASNRVALIKRVMEVIGQLAHKPMAFWGERRLGEAISAPCRRIEGAILKVNYKKVAIYLFFSNILSLYR